MLECTGKLLKFPACKHRKVEAEFKGGESVIWESG